MTQKNFSSLGTRGQIMYCLNFRLVVMQALQFNLLINYWTNFGRGDLDSTQHGD